MGMSTEHREWLEALYETWGLAKVREELERSDRKEFAHPEVTAFARAWVEAKEAGLQRTKRSMATLAIFGSILLGAGIALMFAL